VTALVCGGRDYADRERVREILDDIHALTPITTLVHGAAPGADSLAFEWAIANNIPARSFPADWQKHGKAAGPIRNQQMLDEGRPDIVVAFPGGRGTADMVTRSRAHGASPQRIYEVSK